MYQGLIINLLSRAAWKKGSYKGRDILPGQFGAVMGRLAESLEVPKTTLHRMVFHLAEDGFLTVENVGHRFTIITIKNWHIYQDQGKDDWNAGGTPTEHQRNAGGTPSYKEEEVKKEEDKNKNTTTQGNTENVRGAPVREASQGEYSDFSDTPGIEFQELRQFYDDHCRPEAPLTGFVEYKQLRASRRWPGISRICDAIDNHSRADPEGWKSFCPGLVKFLREQWWEKKPSARASPQQGDSPLRENMQISAQVLAERQRRRQANDTTV